MNDSPVDEKLKRALETFQRSIRDQTVESGLDVDGDQPVVQLRKACRLLEAARTLRRNNGYATSVIELSFAAIERSLQFYLMETGTYDTDDFFDHESVYVEGATPGVNLYDAEMAEDFRTLWRNYRSAVYYRQSLATLEQADSMFELADAVHEWILNFAKVSHECHCSHDAGEFA